MTLSLLGLWGAAAAVRGSGDSAIVVSLSATRRGRRRVVMTATLDSKAAMNSRTPPVAASWSGCPVPQAATLGLAVRRSTRHNAPGTGMTTVNLPAGGSIWICPDATCRRAQVQQPGTDAPKGCCAQPGSEQLDDPRHVGWSATDIWGGQQRASLHYDGTSWTVKPAPSRDEPENL